MPTLETADAEALAREIHDDWTLTDQRLQRQVKTADFASALALGVHIAMVAEGEGHHPDLHVAWAALGIELWTHAAGGLTRNDFILAAKIDEILALA